MKRVVILRGLPGSGKTTYREHQWAGLAIVCSADDEHINPETGKYEFKKELAGIAHINCYKKFLFRLPYTDPVVVVDNTNISPYEIAPYYQAALAYGWEPEVITLWCTPEVAMSRNTHNVPATTILDMYRRLLTEQLPPWWKHSVITQ